MWKGAGGKEWWVINRLTCYYRLFVVWTQIDQRIIFVNHSFMIPQLNFILWNFPQSM